MVKPNKRNPTNNKKRKHSDDKEDANDENYDIELHPMEIELVLQQQKHSEQQHDDDNEDGDDRDDSLTPTTLHSITSQSSTPTPPSHPRRVTDPLPYYNNTEGLKQALKDIQLPSSYPWPEYMSLTCEKSIYQTLKENGDTQRLKELHTNDLLRESLFYSITLAGVNAGISKISEHPEIPLYRPADYYCEMLKPDIHMKKIKEKLLIEKQRINTVNQRKTQTEQRKISKLIQAEKMKEKSQVKKRAKLEAEKYQSNTPNGRDDFKIQRSTLPLIDQTLQHNQSSSSSGKHGENNRNKVNHRRQHKNEKYGFGGKKKHLKENTAESSGDMTQFSNKRHRSDYNGANKKPMHKRTMSGKGSHRMGKSVRQRIRNRG